MNNATSTTTVTTTSASNSNAPERVVYRNLALPVPVFDYIKDYQRGHMGCTGEHLSITQVVSAIVRGYQQQQQNEASEVHETASKQPAILRRN